MRAGVLFGVAAYSLWGLFPLYFPLLDPAGSLEVLAHRITWSLVFVGGALLLAGRGSRVRDVLADRRTARLLSVAAVLVALNWGIYIYAVSTDHVIDAALGYFVTPLVSVGFGLLVFGERLRPLQAVALGLGTVAVVVLAVAAGRFPWIALVLAVTWGTYGLLKKLAGVGAAESLAAETLVLGAPAVVFLTVLGLEGSGTFTREGLGHASLLVAAGPVTAIPLVLFAACVTRIPLTTVGLLQYITPTLQFLIGWLVASEPMSSSRWAGFALVWTALVLLTWDGTVGASRAAEPEPAIV